MKTLLMAELCYDDEHGTRPLPGKSRAEGEAPAWATVSEVEQFIDSQCALRYNTVRSQVEIAWKEGEVDKLTRPSDTHFLRVVSDFLLAALTFLWADKFRAYKCLNLFFL